MKILLPAILILLHPVHVSLTGIEYDSMNQVYSVFVKVWSDDLEADIKLGSTEGNQLTGDEREIFYKYLTDRILIIEDGKQLKMTLLKSETDGIEHRFNLEAGGSRAVKNVTVINRIMTRLYEDQANMLLFSFNGIEDGYRFTTADTLKNYKVK
ncbi:MAG TPA: DUF6702 family protein [Bacteroidales bacterium]|nr:DUF6702 family protein [Bacteroidales bacterium]